jgi:hypothetical protein
MDAASAAGEIANRLRNKAEEKSGEDRKHWHAMSAGARLVAVKLIELADGAKAPPT